MQIITIFFSAILFFTAIYALIIFIIVVRNMWNRAVHPWKGISVMLVGITLFTISMVTAAIATNKLSVSLANTKSDSIFNFSSSESLRKSSQNPSNAQNQSIISSSSRSRNPDDLYGN